MRQALMPAAGSLLSRPMTPAIHALYYGRRRRQMFRAGTYLALLRAMAVGDLVAAFYSHSDLVPHTQARLGRTRETLRVLICHGLDSAAGQAAIVRLRAVHQGLDATSDDFAYVLCLFILEPVRWNAFVGGSPLSDEEAHTLLTFWGSVGESMGIAQSHRRLAEWQQFQADYEARRWRFTEQGQRLASACLHEVVTLSLPRGAQQLFRAVLQATMDPALRQILRLPAPAAWWAGPLRTLLRWSTP